MMSADENKEQDSYWDRQGLPRGCWWLLALFGIGVWVWVIVSLIGAYQQQSNLQEKGVWTVGEVISTEFSKKNWYGKYRFLLPNTKQILSGESKAGWNEPYITGRYLVVYNPEDTSQHQMVFKSLKKEKYPFGLILNIPKDSIHVPLY